MQWASIPLSVRICCYPHWQMPREPLLRPIEPPLDPPARWTDIQLPSYRHVPGLTPHPVRSPEGHSPGGMRVDIGSQLAVFPHAWSDCPAYLFGVDLFNLRYYWEAHESWEEVWNAVGHRTRPGRMLQGMIQVAAALLKQHMESATGAARNFRKACRHFDAIEVERTNVDADWTTYLGVPLRRWRLQVAAFLASTETRHPDLILDFDESARRLD